MLVRGAPVLSLSTESRVSHKRCLCVPGTAAAECSCCPTVALAVTVVAWEEGSRETRRSITVRDSVRSHHHQRAVRPSDSARHVKSNMPKVEQFSQQYCNEFRESLGRRGSGGRHSRQRRTVSHRAQGDTFGQQSLLQEGLPGENTPRESPRSLLGEDTARVVLSRLLGMSLRDELAALTRPRRAVTVPMTGDSDSVAFDSCQDWRIETSTARNSFLAIIIGRWWFIHRALDRWWIGSPRCLVDTRSSKGVLRLASTWKISSLSSPFFFKYVHWSAMWRNVRNIIGFICNLFVIANAGKILLRD